jgi:arylsulfatase A-like enzyme
VRHREWDVATVRGVLDDPLLREQRDASRPFFMWMNFWGPHSPSIVPEPWYSMYEREAIAEDPAYARGTQGKPMHVQHISRMWGVDQIPWSQWQKIIACYYGYITMIDDCIGELIRELKEQGLYDSTLIVFTADHGDWAGEMGLWSKTGGIRNSAICRVPLVVRLPGEQVSDQVETGIVETIDVFPTVCELAGIDPKIPLQGRSFAPRLKGDDWVGRDDALTENAGRKVLTTPRWRYLSNLPGWKDELFDREADPWETHNLIDDPELAPVLSELRALLLRRLSAARLPVVGYGGGEWRRDYDQDGFSLSPGDVDFKNSL